MPNGSLSLSLVLEESSKYLGNLKRYTKYSNNIKSIASQSLNKDDQFFTSNICHGYASMLYIKLLAHKNNNDIVMLRNLEDTIINILNCFNENNEYGFKNNGDMIYKSILKSPEINSYDFLEGTTGIVLALSLVFNDDICFSKLLFID